MQERKESIKTRLSSLLFMNKLFSYEGLYYRVFSFIANLLLLNLLFWLTSITIILIGPAVMALYQTIYQMIKEQESSVVLAYLKNLTHSLKRGLVLTLFLSLFVIGLGTGVFTLFQLSAYFGFFVIILFGLSLLFLCTFMIIYSIYPWPLKKSIHETIYVVLSSSANSIILFVLPILICWFMTQWVFFLFVALGVSISACLQLFFFIKVLEDNENDA